MSTSPCTCFSSAGVNRAPLALLRNAQEHNAPCCSSSGLGLSISVRLMDDVGRASQDELLAWQRSTSDERGSLPPFGLTCLDSSPGVAPVLSNPAGGGAGSAPARGIASPAAWHHLSRGGPEQIADVAQNLEGLRWQQASMPSDLHAQGRFALGGNDTASQQHADFRPVAAANDIWAPLTTAQQPQQVGASAWSPRRTSRRASFPPFTPCTLHVFAGCGCRLAHLRGVTVWQYGSPIVSIVSIVSPLHMPDTAGNGH